MTDTNTTVNYPNQKALSPEKAWWLFTSQKNLLESAPEAIETRIKTATEDLLVVYPESWLDEPLDQIIEREIEKWQAEEEVLVKRFIDLDEVILRQLRIIPQRDWYLVAGLIPTQKDEKLVGLAGKARAFYLQNKGDR